ncbi:MAG: ATP-binding protein [Coriobacteriia bacterium]|nr:ATP-binding protein [Coriobacteriia bacterium]
MHADCIRLTVPARGEYAKTVRMTAAQLASRIGMSYDQVDDVRIAAEEAFVYACECAADTAEITFDFEITGSTLSVRVGPLPTSCMPEAGAASENYAEFILRSVCDDFSVEHVAGECVLRLTCATAVLPGDPVA